MTKYSKEFSRQIANGIYDGFFKIWTIVILSMVFSWVLLGLTGFGVDDSNKSAWSHSGFTIMTDARTGLQYLKGGSGLTPRLDENGKQIRETN